jgi:Domain of unknown function (DUF6916)
MDQVFEPSYATLSDLAGREVSVVPCVLDGGDPVPLTLECLTTPVSHHGGTSYSVLLTGPADAPLPPGRYLVQHGDATFVLSLERFAREMRFVHYEAYLTETAA